MNALTAMGKVASYPGENAFRLYDTFGLPRDFIEDACRDAGIVFDSAGFDAAMEEQRKRAQASWKGGSKAIGQSRLSGPAAKTVFEGYRKTLTTGTRSSGDHQVARWHAESACRS